MTQAEGTNATAIAESRAAKFAANLGPYGPQLQLSVIADPTEETWAYLQAMGLRSRFIELATKVHAISEADAAKTYPVARHFIRQAHDYYAAARTSSSSSAPLLHYYGVLNLSKFMLALSAPHLLKERRQLQHGLRVEGDASPPQEARLLVSDGIFISLTQRLAVDAPPGSMSVKDLLARCVDMSAEYAEGWKQEPEFARAAITARSEQERTKRWARVELIEQTVPDINVLMYTGSPLASDFHRVAAPTGRVAFESNSVLDVSPDQRTADSTLRALVRRLRACLSSTGDFQEANWSIAWTTYALPYALGNHPPLPEMSALFAVAFYLSDIVRYHPDIIADDSTSTDSWVLGSFSRSGPAKFAQLALDFLTGREYRLKVE
jgi:YaaC-like protein